MDAKAWAMSKLPGWSEHALERAEQMCQKWPTDFRVLPNLQGGGRLADD